jgi:hypothetical protein
MLQTDAIRKSKTGFPWAHTSSARKFENTVADNQKSHTTVERYLQILNNRLIPRWAKRPALEIQPLEIKQWLKDSKREENLENPAVDKIRRVMNLVYNHGQTYGLIPRTEEANPMKFVRVKTQSEYEARIITPEQSFKILTAATPSGPV